MGTSAASQGERIGLTVGPDGQSPSGQARAASSRFGRRQRKGRPSPDLGRRPPEAELYVTDSQKNSADGKTEGVYTGYSCLVTESAPQGATDPNAKKQNTYKVDFSEHKEKDDHMRPPRWMHQSRRRLMVLVWDWPW